MAGTKDINFGQIDHFLFVRIMSVCADLGFSMKEFVEEGYYHCVGLIDEKGTTRFQMLADQYREYESYREQTRYAPRMIEKKHQVVVQGIHEEIHKHLTIIKDENGFRWINILQAMLLLLELNIDRADEETFREAMRRKEHALLEEIFSDSRLDMAPGGYSVDTPDALRKWENERDCLEDSEEGSPDYEGNPEDPYLED